MVSESWKQNLATKKLTQIEKVQKTLTQFEHEVILNKFIHRTICRLAKAHTNISKDTVYTLFVDQVHEVRVEREVISVKDRHKNKDDSDDDYGEFTTPPKK